MSARRDSGPVRRRALGALLVISTTSLAACAEIEVGIEAAKRANRALTGGDTATEPQARPRAVRIAQGQTGSQSGTQQSAVSPYLEPAPEIFEATGRAEWDGKRTLQGVWVAHPLATTARRVRIFNTDNGRAVDGALFKRDAALGGASVLISSEAAQRLGMTAGSSAELRIVAVTPTERPVTEPPAAEDVAEDQTDRPVENPPAAETEPETAETQPADAPETAEAPDADADAQPDRVAAVPPTPIPNIPGGHQPAPMVGTVFSTQSTNESLGLSIAILALFSEPPPLAATSISTLSPSTKS